MEELREKVKNKLVDKIKTNYDEKRKRSPRNGPALVREKNNQN
jgi:hypothetical protein